MKNSITDLVDMRSGDVVDGKVFLKQERRVLVQARTELQRVYKLSPDNLWLVCAYCHGAVLLACRNSSTQDFYFRHFPEVENSLEHRCIYKTKGALTASQINAIKYNGAKESLPHRLLKEQLRSSLMADSNISNIAVEKIQKNEMLDLWKKPDVSAVYKQQFAMVFEAQLSTTFLNVIVDRKIFYEAQDAFLVWIFNKFNPNSSLIRQTFQDIYFNNNSNAFVVDEDTTKYSGLKGIFSMDCHYVVPSLDEEKLVITEAWRVKRIGIDELVFDHKNKRVYYFDFDAEKSALLKKINSLREIKSRHSVLTSIETKGNLPSRYSNELQEQIDQAKKLSIQAIGMSKSEIFSTDLFVNFFSSELENFERLWQQNSIVDDEKYLQFNWNIIREKLSFFGIDAPEYINHSPYKTMITAILSAKKGRVFGCKHDKIISVAHNLVETCPQFLMQFRLTLKHTNHQALIDQQDREGKLKRKLSAYKTDKRETDQKWDAFIEFLVPHFRGRLVKLSEDPKVF